MNKIQVNWDMRDVFRWCGLLVVFSACNGIILWMSGPITWDSYLDMNITFLIGALILIGFAACLQRWVVIPWNKADV